jgi:hypothetical protein
VGVVMLVQGFQCVDGHRVSTSTISQPLLGCGQLQLFKSITLVYNHNYELLAKFNHYFTTVLPKLILGC